MTEVQSGLLSLPAELKPAVLEHLATDGGHASVLLKLRDFVFPELYYTYTNESPPPGRLQSILGLDETLRNKHHLGNM